MLTLPDSRQDPNLNFFVVQTLSQFDAAVETGLMSLTGKMHRQQHQLEGRRRRFY